MHIYVYVPLVPSQQPPSGTCLHAYLLKVHWVGGGACTGMYTGGDGGGGCTMYAACIG